MNRIRSRTYLAAIGALVLMLAFAQPRQVSPASSAPASDMQSATLVLDWFPNTNHAGIYLAQAYGWYAEQGLDLRIEAPSDVNAATKLTANGTAEIGISYQPVVNISRAQDIPLVSVAALVQHNLGSFASKADSGITRPSDFVGKRYGTSSLPQSMAQLRTAVQCDGADPSSVEEVTLGQQLTQAMLANRVDFMAMLPTWEGLELELKGTPLNYINYRDWCLPDQYTLVFVSSEQTIRNKPEVLQKFLAATQRGYEASVVAPADAIAALLAAAPDLDPTLVAGSMDRLNPYFIADAPHWGWQDPDRWTTYANWMAENGLIAKPIDGSKAFTNDFLPQ